MAALARGPHSTRTAAVMAAACGVCIGCALLGEYEVADENNAGGAGSAQNGGAGGMGGDAATCPASVPPASAGSESCFAGGSQTLPDSYWCPPGCGLGNFYYGCLDPPDAGSPYAYADILTCKRRDTGGATGSFCCERAACVRSIDWDFACAATNAKAYHCHPYASHPPQFCQSSNEAGVVCCPS